MRAFRLNENSRQIQAFSQQKRVILGVSKMGGARSAVVGQKRATATFQSEGPCTAYRPNNNAAGVARF